MKKVQNGWDQLQELIKEHGVTIKITLYKLIFDNVLILFLIFTESRKYY